MKKCYYIILASLYYTVLYTDMSHYIF